MLVFDYQLFPKPNIDRKGKYYYDHADLLVIFPIFSDAKPFTDDTRLSKLVRRLCRDDDRDRRLTAGKQLREIMPLPENVKVI